MQSLLTPSLPENSMFEETPVCEALILYQDLSTGKRAMETLQRLVGKMGHGCLFRYHLFSFGALKLPQIHDDVAEHAVRADIILFSVRADAEVPAEVKAWTERWLRKRTARNCALVALVGQSRDQVSGPTSVHAYLQETARKGQMDFFSQNETWAGEQEDFSSQAFRHPKVSSAPFLGDRHVIPAAIREVA
jgi:hypothetical protein